MTRNLPDVYLNPFTDFGFKKLFGEEANKQLLIDFLNSFLPPYHQIAELSYTKSEQLGRTEEDRKAIYDLACISKDTGERFIVEMQKAKQTYFKDRSIFYSTFPIQEQAQKGDWNYQLSAVYTFGILDFEFNDDKKSGDLDAVHTVQMKDQNNRVYYDKLTFIYITLPSFTKTEAELVTHQDKWIYAFKHLATFDEIPKALQESIFLDFFETARVAKLDDEEYGVYQESIKAHRDWFSIYQTYEHNLAEAKKAAELSRQEGIEEGIELGKQEGIELGKQEGIELGKQEGIELGKQERDIEIANAMLAQGLAVSVIASITGLTVEQIEGLK